MVKIHKVNPDVARAHVLRKLKMRMLALYMIGQGGRNPRRAEKALTFEANRQKEGRNVSA